ncbi:hypothetical protein Misp02_42710 [Microtetraspora sp. NBRC 16547]|nr:hypothetical protein Misp02_42710 [Microtetraspora sp. NBRC 16547]
MRRGGAKRRDADEGDGGESGKLPVVTQAKQRVHEELGSFVRRQGTAACVVYQACEVKGGPGTGRGAGREMSIATEMHIQCAVLIDWGPMRNIGRTGRRTRIRRSGGGLPRGLLSWKVQPPVGSNTDTTHQDMTKQTKSPRECKRSTALAKDDLTWVMSVREKPRGHGGCRAAYGKAQTG